MSLVLFGGNIALIAGVLSVLRGIGRRERGASVPPAAASGEHAVVVAQSAH
jgi:hypothetical protein